MVSPTFRRFWVKVIGGRWYPQFSPDGKEHAWREYPNDHVEKVLYLSFSKKFAAKVGPIAEAIDLPELDIPVTGSGSVQWCRKNTIRRVPHTVCGFCGAELVEGSIAICPRCFAANRWYCDRCDTLKGSPKIDKKGNALCPDCDRGMLRIEQIGEWWDEAHNHHDILDFDGKRHIVLDPVISK